MEEKLNEILEKIEDVKALQVSQNNMVIETQKSYHSVFMVLKDILSNIALNEDSIHDTSEKIKAVSIDLKKINIALMQKFKGEKNE